MKRFILPALNWKRFSIVLFVAAFLCCFPGRAWTQGNPYGDSEVSVEQSSPPGEVVSTRLPVNPGAVEMTTDGIATISVGNIATFTIGPADIIEQAGQLICMAGNPVGCLVSVIAGLYKNSNGSTVDKAISGVGNLSPLPGPIGIVGKVVRYGNYGKTVYDNKDKIAEAVKKTSGNLGAQQSPAPVEDREILPLPKVHEEPAKVVSEESSAEPVVEGMESENSGN